jgi:hypothetical protein
MSEYLDEALWRENYRDLVGDDPRGSRGIV